jgi:prolipoprotein diacylglyceryltransferase
MHERRRFAGQVFLAYLLAYPLLRGAVEVFRGDAVRGVVFDGLLSTGQLISLLVALFAATLLYLRLRQAGAVEAPPPPE